MKKVNFVDVGSVLLISLFLFSCSGLSSQRHSHAASEPKYQIVPRMADSVAQYYYAISSSVKSRYQVNDKKMESTGTSDLGLVFRMAKDSGDGIVVSITYDKLHVIMDNGSEHKDITARKGDSTADPVERMLGNILGSVLTLTLDKGGNIRKVSGTKELAQKILGAMGGADPAVRTTVEGQLGRLAGEAFVRSTLQQVFKLVPDSVQYVGDTWTHTQESDGLKLSIATTYTLKDVDGHVASIVGSSDIRDEGDEPVLFMDQSFPATISGEQESHFRVDLPSGLALEGQAKLSLKGTLQVLGKEVPIQIESQKKIEGKRM